METELITSIIIEDEKNNADLLAHFVKKYCKKKKPFIEHLI